MLCFSRIFLCVIGNEGPKAPEGRQQLGWGIPENPSLPQKAEASQFKLLMSISVQLQSTNAAFLDKC
eukprot:1161589-Pelagomonas_calceolata.AAC.3